ncbi:nuclear transport factor 2 family protein [Mycobacteroides immunogenum]|uniref:Steroid delta-isomerase n=1 Tax=Mycobacteroides immunogenum TaxID=83262 RepID=A0A0N0KPV6_9MYCO|nr:nuclear transport factor 2 family protein [Mycobacteroides immunogenum]AMT70037.1 steroid delta-isomerase [Mycobacteroides immunogenum]ANO03103.1 steroid delta-isomerase [Mycobacteroides immunogenum]KIU38648.1 steroid delta-isomerase [Mycobacteroides immunogenum]KPG10096.1 steroid delta-isomerase [Mycobacteroides immunogenum]KPG12327.1 steroid delta-isomerase [Mycobacteroides immunogenum]
MTVTREHVLAVVQSYCDLLTTGTAAQIADLYADDATVEDPLGADVLKGREAIQGFYATIEPLDRHGELKLVRATNNEAAFSFELTIKHENGGMVIAPIDVMTFNDEGKISSMRAFWTQDDIKQL